MKKVIGIIVISLFLLIQTVSAIPTTDIIPIEEGFPTTIIAGSTYESSYQFDNIQPINLIIFFNITNEQYTVDHNETFVKIKLNNNLLDCNETLGGVFKCEEQDISQIGTNIINVTFSSRIDLQPAEDYIFKLSGMVGYEEEKVKEEKIYFAGGGGGGGNLQRDTDRDGICDWFEKIRRTDPNDSCDPNPNCAACLATKSSPTPTEAPKPLLVTEKKIPSRPEPVVIPPLESEKKPSLLFYGFCFALVGAGVVFLIYRLRKRALEKGEEEEEIEEETEGEVYWE